MTDLFFCSILFAININPQNTFFDHYEVVPVLGKVKSIATSTSDIFMISDNYLIVLDKNNLNLKKTFSFDTPIDLLAYDQGFDDLWITSNTGILRFNITLSNIREYKFSERINSLGIGNDYLYLDTGRKYSLNRTSGEIKSIGSFPDNLRWYKRTTESAIKKYPFLAPYYYYDELGESQSPFYKYPISAIYDDGMYLYVGTNGYGLLKYNQVSWQNERIIYGPLNARIKKVRNIGGQVYFLSSAGISSYEPGPEINEWHYLRVFNEIADLIALDSNLIVSIRNQVSHLEGTMLFPISDFKNDVRCINLDNKYIYVGTNSGMFKLVQGTNEPIQFGPDKYPVYAIHSDENSVYVGGEFAFYKYNKKDANWFKVINRGIKEIVKINDEFYLHSIDNQIIRYRDIPNESISVKDTTWILLPYFNIYGIDTDNEVLYCASYAGIYYYNPADQLYKIVYNLPRIKYDYIFVIDDNILAVSDKGIYRLPIKYRD